MKQKYKNFKREIVRKVAQSLADGFITLLDSTVKSKNSESFDSYFELAAKLNAYCIVFHDIYLD
jgi:hypothetical protein